MERRHVAKCFNIFWLYLEIWYNQELEDCNNYCINDDDNNNNNINKFKYLLF